jgi:putative nucleotidyltransferase with HDIG domain
MTHAPITPASLQIEHLPPLPAIVQRLLEVTKSARSSADDVARVLREDAAVAAKILRVANSPFYGACRKITEVTRAVVRLGTTAVQNLVLGLCVRNTLLKKAASSSEHASLWYHSVVAASASELIGRQIGYKPLEEAFVAGLLHDIGHLAMLILRPKAFRECLQIPPGEMTQMQAERATFGIDHADLGYAVMNQWRLPESLCRVVRDHHALQIPSEERLLMVVSLADLLAYINGYGLDRPLGPIARPQYLSDHLGLSSSDLQHIFSNLDRRVGEAIDMLAEKPPPPPSFGQLDHAAAAVWLSDETELRGDLCQQLLEKRGYELRCVPMTDESFAPAPGELVFVDETCEAAGSAAGLDARLAAWKDAKVVLMGEPSHGIRVRARDRRAGVCRIPRLFSAFDVQWVETELKP